MDELAQAGDPVEIFRVYWTGKGPLSGAYWKYGVAGALGLYIFAMFGIPLLLPAALKGHQSVLESPIFRTYLLVVYLVMLAYQVVVWVQQRVQGATRETRAPLTRALGLK